MIKYLKISFAFIALGIACPSLAQDDREELQIAAMEALIAAPADRAVPIATRVVRGNYSDEVKERALFVLSQVDTDEAQGLLIEVAKSGSPELRSEAIRMVGIGGNDDSLALLSEVYVAGDADIREAVLEAYLIADDADAVARIAENASSEEEFEEAVETLAAMGAREHLRALSGGKPSEALIEALAISGDVDGLRTIATDGSDPELQKHAIEALGIVGGDDVNTLLMEIYRGSTSEDIHEAALEGMLISGYDAGVLELYRSSQDPDEKRQLLEMLVIMDSDAIFDAIDSILTEDQ